MTNQIRVLVKRDKPKPGETFIFGYDGLKYRAAVVTRSDDPCGTCELLAYCQRAPVCTSGDGLAWDQDIVFLAEPEVLRFSNQTPDVGTVFTLEEGGDMFVARPGDPESVRCSGCVAECNPLLCLKLPPCLNLVFKDWPEGKERGVKPVVLVESEGGEAD